MVGVSGFATRRDDGDATFGGGHTFRLTPIFTQLWINGVAKPSSFVNLQQPQREDLRSARGFDSAPGISYFARGERQRACEIDTSNALAEDALGKFEKTEADPGHIDLGTGEARRAASYFKH